jgi:hypothetical protein
VGSIVLNNKFLARQSRSRADRFSLVADQIDIPKKKKVIQRIEPGQLPKT